MLKTLIRPAMIFVPLTLGMFFPAAGACSGIIRYLLMIMLFMVFLGLDVREMKPRKSHFLLLLSNLIIGIVCFILTGWLTGEKNVAQAGFFVGITPTATAAAVVMAMLGGNVGYVLTSFVVTNVGIACVLPFLMGIVCGNSSWGFMLRVLESLVWLLVIPYVVSLFIRKLHPAAVSWPKKFKTQTFALWSVALFIIAGTAAEFFQNNPDISWWIVLEIALIALVICALNFACGYYLGENSFKREASQSLGQKNTTLTIYLALTFAGPLAAMGVISYVFWHNSYNALQMFFHDRQRSGCNQSK